MERKNAIKMGYRVVLIEIFGKNGVLKTHGKFFDPLSTRYNGIFFLRLKPHSRLVQVPLQHLWKKFLSLSNHKQIVYHIWFGCQDFRAIFYFLWYYEIPICAIRSTQHVYIKEHALVLSFQIWKLTFFKVFVELVFHWKTTFINNYFSLFCQMEKKTVSSIFHGINSCVIQN